MGGFRPSHRGRILKDGVVYTILDLESEGKSLAPKPYGDKTLPRLPTATNEVPELFLIPLFTLLWYIGRPLVEATDDSKT